MENYISEISGLLVVVVVLIALIILFFPKKSKSEKGEKTIYQERCEIKFSGKAKWFFGGNIPFGYVRFYDTFMVVDYVYPITITYSDINYVKLQKNLFSKKFYMNVNDNITSSEIIFYPKYYEKITTIFKDKNVKLKE